MNITSVRKMNKVNFKIATLLLYLIMLNKTSFSQNNAIFTTGNNSAYDMYTVGGPGTEVILPVELLTFTVNIEKNIVKVKWETATEINNDYYLVEKSKDGVIFEKVAVVKGAGNNNSYLSYNIIDNCPYEGISYYRLKQTDFDGKYKYHNIVSIDMKASLSFKIYPNPSKASQTPILYLDGYAGEVILIEVHDVLGKVYYNKSAEVPSDASFFLENTELPTGIYMLNITTGEKRYSQKLIIQ
jgi:hypothetical protein